jgi:hypothetical protein
MRCRAAPGGLSYVLKLVVTQPHILLAQFFRYFVNRSQLTLLFLASQSTVASGEPSMVQRVPCTHPTFISAPRVPARYPGVYSMQ